MIQRIYVEKKPPFAQEAAGLLREFKVLLGIESLTGLRLWRRYDVEGISAELFAAGRDTVFSDPPVDDCHFVLPTDAAAIFATELLPGQFDQRADSCAQCIQFVHSEAKPLATHMQTTQIESENSLKTQNSKLKTGLQSSPQVATARVYMLYGELSPADIEAVKKYLINPVECREASLDLPQTLAAPAASVEPIPLVEGFLDLDQAGFDALRQEHGLAMDNADLEFCQQHFRAEGRCPTLTELRVIDTYWSDHCRHTTFNTELTQVELRDEQAAAAYSRYQSLRQELGGEKPATMMDIATIGARYLRRQGQLPHLDESEEVNACTVKIDAEVNGATEPWLLFFKNETHNHPTEIEPFGGAATCLGGGLRDPLSGRGYPYLAMRLTGAGDPTVPLAATLPGKLPQRKLTTTAAAGYSSYGNQIGVASGLLQEIYHPGYVAKRMEAGAVLAAAPAAQVKREKPQPGDAVLLVGGPTGRDGCGGAIGSSKTQDASSLTTLGAEVQKGNAPEERKLLRLFRDPQASRLIKRCNDFGAGGVSVAIGELAAGLDIDLDAVPAKYAGLTGTELAISESQERMAVVIAAHDVAAFEALAATQDLQTAIVARVTDSERMIIRWQGQIIADISRAFLDSNGTKKHQQVTVCPGAAISPPLTGDDFAANLRALLGDLNICSQRGIGEYFDSTAGAGTVLMPLGGARQLTPIQAMAAKLPAVAGDTTTCTMMSFGYNPYISSASPYSGAYLAVVESVAKLVSAGGDIGQCWLSFQEFFPKLEKYPERWGLPVAALLGALSAQLDLGLAAIGGKDSMSGSFEQIDVPPTLVSFAVAMADSNNISSPEFKQPGSRVTLLKPAYDQYGLPDATSLRENFNTVAGLIRTGQALAVYTPVYGGAAAGLVKMSLGNGLGLQLAPGLDENALFDYCYGAFLLELAEDAQDIGELLGYTIEAYELRHAGGAIPLAELEQIYEERLENVFPTRLSQPPEEVPAISFAPTASMKPRHSAARPRVLIPALPGANGEYDLARAFTRAGAEPNIVVVRNLSPTWLSESVEHIAQELAKTQILALPGDFFGGGEPDGCGKFTANFFRHPRLMEALHQLLQEQDGLIFGSGSGFQALLKLGLLPNGHISDITPDSPALTLNTIGRHHNKLARIRVASTLSPWLSQTEVGAIYTVAFSHGEGRFVCGEGLFKQLAAQGQIASQYVDREGRPSMDIADNPSGSYMAVEALCSPDGRVFGQMCHLERWNPGNLQNVPGNKDYPVFVGGVRYFE